MHDSIDEALRDLPPPRVAAPGRTPAVVVAAAVITWTMASMTAASVLCLAILVLLLGGPIFDVFEDHQLQAVVIATALVVIALAVIADVLAYLVFRRHRWARWALAALSLASAVVGAMLGYYVAPLAITVAGVTVVVLLFLPSARTWFRSS